MSSCAEKGDSFVRAVRKNRRRFRIGLIIGIILLAAGLATAVAFLADAQERREIQALEIERIDFAHLQDGTYVGEYAGTRGSTRNAIVEASVSEGRIIKIRILKGALDSKGVPAELGNGMTIGSLFQRVLDNQSLQVDVISGATLTSKAHLKALENALKQAQPK
ncbi:FMN-binding protein [Paenibacillus sp. MMS20-IR301]|uniref:FMN-binding protein n=1 Tax=Paenibacillus sp. MMS20-IR301 TaxID=2895946 RepID=UPI0028EBE1DF|nr:FMN-binding protein [Paenibacillus sp. MMS20-IR301]WNS45238.1 FMN-binding protein [Paenibacillus sp. MMS20-IR301]